LKRSLASTAIEASVGSCSVFKPIDPAAAISLFCFMFRDYLRASLKHAAPMPAPPLFLQCLRSSQPLPFASCALLLFPNRFLSASRKPGSHLSRAFPMLFDLPALGYTSLDLACLTTTLCLLVTR
jgi:hypothetical protein